MSLEWIIEGEEGLYRGPACVGVIKGKTGWILIDSTVEMAVIKKVVKALPPHNLDEEKKGIEVNISAVINTHAHADHCGGNAWLTKYCKPLICASSGEKVYIESPHLEPHYLFSAQAPKALMGKFFVSEPSHVNSEINFNNASNEKTKSDSNVISLMIDGIPLRMVQISGHSPEMMGVITENQTFYCGDLLFTPMILEKHPLLFLHDYEAYLNSVQWCQRQSFSNVVLTHGGHFTDHIPLAIATEQRLLENLNLILKQVQVPIDEWSLHHLLVEEMGLVEDFGAWHLNHGVIRSYLGYALKAGLLSWKAGKYEKSSSI